MLLHLSVWPHVDIYLFALFIAVECKRLVGPISVNKKDSRHSSAAQWHQALKWFQWICPPPRWAFQIRPATLLLSSAFPWKSIHLYSFTHLLPDPIHPMSSCTLKPLCEAFTSYQHLLYFHRQYSYCFYSPSHLTSFQGTGLSDTSPRKKKKKAKWLSISFC